MSEKETITEEQLEQVAGGAGRGCYFVPTANYEDKRGYEPSWCWLKCARANSIDCKLCDCQGTDHCVNLYHKFHIDDAALLPLDFSNHRSKKGKWLKTD